MRVDFRQRVLVFGVSEHVLKPRNGRLDEIASSRRASEKRTSGGRVPGRSTGGQRRYVGFALLQGQSLWL